MFWIEKDKISSWQVQTKNGSHWFRPTCDQPVEMILRFSISSQQGMNLAGVVKVYQSYLYLHKSNIQSEISFSIVFTKKKTNKKNEMSS